MADNYTFKDASGVTQTAAGNDIGPGVQYPRIKVTWGAAGTANDADIASGKALPVQLRDSAGAEIDLIPKVGSVTETAPTTDTASSGLNGRLQRLAQRITSLIALVPAALSAAGNFKVVINESGTATPVTQSGTWTVQPGNTANTTAWLTSQVPATSGGLTIYRLLSAATTNGNNIKASAGQLYGFVITNVNAAARFVKLYNKATAPTVGTDTPVMTLVIPGNANGSGMVAAEFTSGIAFGTGIGIAITGVVTDADATAVAANEVVVNLLYK